MDHPTDAELLAAIVGSSDDAILSKDLNGIVTSWNRAAERMYGYTAAEMIGQPVERIVPNDRRGEVGDVLERIRDGQRIDRYNTERVTKDGRHLIVSITVSPIRNEQGRIVGASSIGRDITAMMLANKELRDIALGAAARAAAIDDLASKLDEQTSVLVEISRRLEGLVSIEALEERVGQIESLSRRRRRYAATIVLAVSIITTSLVGGGVYVADRTSQHRVCAAIRDNRHVLQDLVNLSTVDVEAPPSSNDALRQAIDQANARAVGFRAAAQGQLSRSTC